MEREDQQEKIGLSGHLLSQRDAGSLDGIVGVAALSGGVEVADLQSIQQHASLDDIAGGARHGTDQGSTSADEVVEKARFTGVDRTDQGHSCPLDADASGAPAIRSGIGLCCDRAQPSDH